MSARVAIALAAFSGGGPGSQLLPEFAASPPPPRPLASPARLGCDGGAPARPLSHADFLARVRTFRASTWFGKPLPPFQCARRGWENAGLDSLACRWCGACLRSPSSGSAAPPLAPPSLRLAHAEACPWRESSCPRHFSALPPPRALHVLLAPEGRRMAAAAAPGMVHAAVAGELARAWEGAVPLAAVARGGCAGAGGAVAALAAALLAVGGGGGGGGGAAPPAGEGALPLAALPALLGVCGWRLDERAAGGGGGGGGGASARGAKRPRAATGGGEGEGEGEGEGGVGGGWGEGEGEGPLPAQLPVACHLCGARAVLGGAPPPPPPAPAASPPPPPAAPAAQPSALLLAARKAMQAAATAVAAFSEGGGGGAAGAPASPPPPTRPPAVFHLVRDHVWCCPYARPSRLPPLPGAPGAGDAAAAAAAAAAAGAAPPTAASLAASVVAALVKVSEAAGDAWSSDAVARALASGADGAQWGALRARVEEGGGAEGGGGGEGGGGEEEEGEPRGGLPGWLCVALALVEGGGK